MSFFSQWALKPSSSDVQAATAADNNPRHTCFEHVIAASRIGIKCSVGYLVTAYQIMHATGPCPAMDRLHGMVELLQFFALHLARQFIIGPAAFWASSPVSATSNFFMLGTLEVSAYLSAEPMRSKLPTSSAMTDCFLW